jgi:hypothetical protein
MATPNVAAARPRVVVTFNETSEDDGTTTDVVSVAEVAALAILAVERRAKVERVHGTRLPDGLI